MSKNLTREERKKKKKTELAVAKRLIAFLLGHNSFALVLVGDLIIAASNKEISIWKPSIKKKTK